MKLLFVDSCEAKKHLENLLCQVRAGQGFTITQRGEPVADLLPAGSSVHRVGQQAAAAMQRFMLEAPLIKASDMKALIETSRANQS